MFDLPKLVVVVVMMVLTVGDGGCDDGSDKTVVVVMMMVTDGCDVSLVTEDGGGFDRIFQLKTNQYKFSLEVCQETTSFS